MEKVKVKGKLYGKEVEVELDVVGKCPICGEGWVYESEKVFGCTNFKNGCKLTIWKEIAQRKIDKDIVKELIENRITDYVGGFISRKGNRFEARLELTNDGKVRFYSEDKVENGNNKEVVEDEEVSEVN